MKNKLSLRDLTSAQDRREFLEKQLKIKLNNTAIFSFTEEQVAGRNIENLVGATQIPLGVAGPLKISNVIPSERSSRENLTNNEIATVRSVDMNVPRNNMGL